MIEERFGPYTVYECIGAGGMATVHRATFDRGDGVAREVALKRLLPQHVDDKTFIDDFKREGQIASRLHHPGIVAILDLGQIGGTHFIAMELVHGQPLMQLIRKAHVAKKPAPIGVVIALISDLCDALDYACNGNDTLGDRLNIIHRDLSPSNLLVADDGRLRVIDFGVAKGIAGRFATSTGLVKGKLGYMSVEALSGKPLDGRADVFSAGVVSWELLTGRRLFTGANELEIVQRVRAGVVAPPSQLNAACPPTLDAIVQRALARVRDDRWPTAAALRAALEQIRRAYREDSTPAEVMRWREEIGAEPAPRSTRPAMQPMEPVEDPDEVTQHRAPPRRPMVRAMTEIDLLDLEPPASVTIEPRLMAPPEPLPEPEPEATRQASQTYDDLAAAQAPAADLFDLHGDGVSRTFTGELAAHAFGGTTAPNATNPGWPVEGATQLNVDPFATEAPSSTYMEMAVMTEEPSIYLQPLPEPEPEPDLLDLEAPPPPPASRDEELLDLADDGLDPPTMRPTPIPNDTVIVPPSARRTRSLK